MRLSSMRERHWYTRFGVEEPFPWVLFAFWPFLWIYGTYRDVWEWMWTPLIYVKHEPAPVDNRGTLRLWDKDFNILATWKNGDSLYITEDRDYERRRGGIVTKIEFANGPGI